MGRRVAPSKPPSAYAWPATLTATTSERRAWQMPDGRDCRRSPTAARRPRWLPRCPPNTYTEPPGVVAAASSSRGAEWDVNDRGTRRGVDREHLRRRGSRPGRPCRPPRTSSSPVVTIADPPRHRLRQDGRQVREVVNAAGGGCVRCATEVASFLRPGRLGAVVELDRQVAAFGPRWVLPFLSDDDEDHQITTATSAVRRRRIWRRRRRRPLVAVWSTPGGRGPLLTARLPAHEHPTEGPQPRAGGIRAGVVCPVARHLLSHFVARNGRRPG